MELKADRNFFGHMIIIAQSSALPRDVLAHPLGPLTWSLAKLMLMGLCAKQTKLHLRENWRKLYHRQKPIHNLQHDGMNLVQKLKGGGKTFAQLPDSALNLALHEGRLLAVSGLISFFMSTRRQMK